jgi:hypothetical protein
MGKGVLPESGRKRENAGVRGKIILEDYLEKPH